jgi:hypothetical protein
MASLCGRAALWIAFLGMMYALTRIAAALYIDTNNRAFPPASWSAAGRKWWRIAF